MTCPCPCSRRLSIRVAGGAECVSFSDSSPNTKPNFLAGNLDLKRVVLETPARGRDSAVTLSLPSFGSRAVTGVCTRFPSCGGLGKKKHVHKFFDTLPTRGDVCPPCPPEAARVSGTGLAPSEKPSASCLSSDTSWGALSCVGRSLTPPRPPRGRTPRTQRATRGGCAGQTS